MKCEIVNPNCKDCEVKYKMPHEYCCLEECGEHEFCKDCKSVIYLKEDDEVIKENNKKGKISIRYKSSSGLEIKKDDCGRVIYRKTSTDYEYWYEFDENGNKIHYKNSDNYERWSEYDENDNEIHRKDSTGYENWAKFDEQSHKLWFKANTDVEEIYKVINEKSKLVYRKYSDGKEKWITYDEQGRKIKIEYKYPEI
jgi:hypothetical protein